MLHCLSRLWSLTMKEHCLHVHMGQCKGQCQLSSIEVHIQTLIFWLIINIFKQCFRGTYVRGCTCDSQHGRFQGCVLGQLGVESGIHMSDGYFWLGGDIELKLGRMKKTTWSYQCVKEHVCVSVWVPEHRLWVKGTSAWALFYWNCYGLINTGMLFLCKGSHSRVINKYIKLYSALKCVSSIFVCKCIYLIYTHFWPLFDNLIVYVYLFALVLF